MFQSKHRKTTATALLLAATSLSLIGCSSKSVKMQVERPSNFGIRINSLAVQPFRADGSSRHAASILASLVDTGIARNQHVTIQDNADNLLQGQIQVARFNTTHAWKDKVKISKLKLKKDGKKCQYTKTGSVTGSYQVRTRSGQTLGGDSFSEKISLSKSADSCNDAKARLPTDESLLQDALETIATQIVRSISPHTVTTKAKLMDGGSSENELGINYLQDGLFDQAVGIWEQVIAGTSDKDARAAAHHNIGVAHEMNGEWESAHARFADANALKPKSKTHRKALKRVNDRLQSEKILRKSN